MITEGESQDQITYRHILRFLENRDDIQGMCFEAINVFSSLRKELKKQFNADEKIQHIKELYVSMDIDHYRKLEVELLEMVMNLYEYLEIADEGLNL